jgi:hypothetical protein
MAYKLHCDLCDLTVPDPFRSSEVDEQWGKLCLNTVLRLEQPDTPFYRDMDLCPKCLVRVGKALGPLVIKLRAAICELEADDHA